MIKILGMNILLILATLTCISRVAVAQPAVLLVDSHGREVSSYTAAMYADRHKVEVEPAVRAVVRNSSTKVICGFKLHRLAASESPVDVIMRDPINGIAELRPKRRFLTKRQRSKPGKPFFDFDISAFDCDNPRHESVRVPVLMHVAHYDRPRFAASSFTADVAANASIGDEILRVRATEKSADVCAFSISDGSPFDIDGAGVIRLKSKLSPDRHTYQLTVTAIDCSVPAQHTATAAVRVSVLPVKARSRFAAEVCEAKWLGISKSIPLPAGIGSSRIAPRAALSACKFERVSCNLAQVSVNISLSSAAAGNAICDLSHEALKMQQALCGLHEESVSLMQQQQQQLKLQHNSNCKQPSQSAVRNFDGKETFVEVSKSVLAKQHSLGQQFTLHFWLRHGEMPTHKKEQILCSSDTQHHNRHHYSVFLHNCKLILLLRAEPANSDKKSLSPSEWRFALDEVCDSRWHHYAISYNAEAGEDDQVQLVVDGQATDVKPQILDDFPLRRDPESLGSKLTVGACWHSKSRSHRQLLLGQLAALVLLRSRRQPADSLRCLGQCRDRLLVATGVKLPAGAQVASDSLNSQIRLRAASAEDAATVLRLVEFIGVEQDRTERDDDDDDDDEKQKEEDRSVTVTTHVQCNNTDAQISVAKAALQAVAVNGRICLQGHTLQRATAKSLLAEDGVELLSDLEIDQPQRKLSACALRTAPRLTAVESLLWPKQAAAAVGLVSRFNGHQLLLDGEASAAVFQQLLRQIRYRNQHPIIAFRQFQLSCVANDAMQDTSAHTVKLEILYQDSTSSRARFSLDNDEGMAASVAHLHQQQQQQQLQQHEHLAQSHGAAVHAATLHHHDVAPRAATQTAAAVPAIIGVVTAGLLLTVLALLLHRMRSRRPKQQQQQQELQQLQEGGKHGVNVLKVDAEMQDEMEWDNAGLNITVNPLDCQLLAKDDAAVADDNDDATTEANENLLSAESVED